MAGGVGYVLSTFVSYVFANADVVAGHLPGLAETGDGRYLITLTGLCRFDAGEELDLRLPYRQLRASYERFSDDLDDDAETFRVSELPVEGPEAPDQLVQGHSHTDRRRLRRQAVPVPRALCRAARRTGGLSLTEPATTGSMTRLIVRADDRADPGARTASPEWVRGEDIEASRHGEDLQASTGSRRSRAGVVPIESNRGLGGPSPSTILVQRRLCSARSKGSWSVRPSRSSACSPSSGPAWSSVSTEAPS